MAFLYPAWWPGALYGARLLGTSSVSDFSSSNNTGEGVLAVPANNSSFASTSRQQQAAWNAD
jgi:hypothetical protein